LWAGVAPVVVGAAIAVRDDVFAWDLLAAALVVAVAIQIGVNFANDVSDARRGADGADRIGPTRAVASGLVTARAMKLGVAGSFALAAAAGLYLAARSDPILIVVGGVAFVAALGYTGGPFPYGYRALGEVFVFAFFGLVATLGTRFVFDGTLAAAAWWSGAAMGFLASAILMANNVRDIDTDRAAGKITLAVLVGRERARVLFAATIASAFAAAIAGVAASAIPPQGLLMLLGVPLAVQPVRIVFTSTSGPELITALEATARLQIAAAALLAAAFVI
jgi:1,4-dihydroxy-2-naphthoate octaprenyltransferase